jgi:hypothetical protein
LSEDDAVVQTALELLGRISQLVVIDGRLTLPVHSPLTNENI